MNHFLRYLRIAFSATCLIACVLLIALWVRSQSRTYVREPLGYRVVVGKGVMYFGQSLGSARQRRYFDQDDGTPSGVLIPVDLTRKIGMPYVAVTMLALAAAPWLRWRFSLRTLLIATTLIAVVLGLVVWAVR